MWGTKRSNSLILVLKNYLILSVKRNEHGHEIRTVLDRAAKWTIFVVKKVRVWEAPRHTSTELSPDPPSGIQTRFFLIGEIMTFISRFIYELFAISLLAAATFWRTLQPSPLSQYICISSCAKITFTGVALKVFTSQLFCRNFQSQAS